MSSTNDIHVEIQSVSEAKGLPGHDLIYQWVETACLQIDVCPAEVLVRLVDKEESQMLNNQYRGRDKPTNVLSFCADVPDYIDGCELGDIVICADVVQLEAEQQGKQIMAHWAHMVVHGVLHLNGYDHQNDTEAEQMEKIETKILDKLGFPDPYNES